MSGAIGHDRRGYTLERKMIAGKTQHWFVVQCGACPRVERIHLSTSMPPVAIAQKFQNRGWHVDRRNPKHNLCAACQRGGKPKPMLPVCQEGSSPMSSAPSHPASEVTAQITTGAVRAPTMPEIRRILNKVADHFDEASGRYLAGYSDERVAAELDLPRALVAKVRDESGMKLKGNPELLALRDELAAIRDLLEGCDAKLQRLEKAGR
jgi:hypothetical protein